MSHNKIDNNLSEKKLKKIDAFKLFQTVWIESRKAEERTVAEAYSK